MSGSIVIVGAGIVGLACGRALQRAGFDVTLVDRGAPGEGASFGSAAHIATASIIPQATPGVLRQMLKLLREPNGPLIVRPGYVVANLPWFLRFLSNGSREKMLEGSVAMAAMIARAWASWRPVFEDAECAHLVQASGALHVFRSKAALAAARESYALRRDLGVASTELDADAAIALEPALSPAIAGAVHIPGMGYVSDTLALSRHLAARIVRAGGRIEKAVVTHVDNHGATTDRGRLDADVVVLAAGAWAKRFAAQLGYRMPLAAERGYHIMLAANSYAPAKPLLLNARLLSRQCNTAYV